MRDHFDEDGHTVCGKCLHVIVEGEWPFCPHPMREGSVNIEQDEIPGGMVLENYGPHPVTVYSHSERRKLMQERGLIQKEKFSPLPGTDIDPAGIPNPKGYMDATTRRNAEELLLRAHNSSGSKDWDPVEAGVIINQKDGVLTHGDAKAIAGGDARRQSRLFRRMQ